MKIYAKYFLSVVTLLSVSATHAVAAPQITGISDNKAAYTNAQVPKYEKYEITFSVNNSVATNTFFPYDTNTPPGVTPGTGITVNAIFLPPGTSDWTKGYTTPAFYYQDFDYAVKTNGEWMYPNGNFYWKVRFSPNVVGTWQYKLTALDASGSTESTIQSFTVADSTSHGFLRVSPKDSRYFEFDDGTFFPGLGYNLTFGDVNGVDPVTGNQAKFAQYKQKGLQLFRMWQSQWAIFGSFWNPWHYIGDLADYTWLTPKVSYGTNDFSMYINRGLSEAPNPCVSFGTFMSYAPAIKPNTTYRIRARVKTTLMGSAIDGTKPHGLVVKFGQWLDNCGDPGVGSIKSSYLSSNSDWTTLTGSVTTGSSDNFLPYIYLALENISQGKAYLDHLWIEEDKGNGQYGANVISKPSMSHYQYVDQRNSYAFDKMLELAHQNDIYFKLVGLEKNDVIPNLTNFDGTVGSNAANPNTNEQSVGNFYGNYGQPTKVYWQQQAWWRYQQARWGYSPNIHSWELINEGDPGNGNLWKLTDEMGKFMKCRAFGVAVSADDGNKCTASHPNAHMVTTSFWTTFADGFWGNAKWPNVDYADIHAYISTAVADTDTKNKMKYDAAYYHQWASHLYGTGTNRIKMPIMRGEAGLDENTVQSESALVGLNKDTKKVWLHNYIWAGVYPGALYEEYWWWRSHMTDAAGTVDPNNDYLKFGTFLKGIPLSNGKYKDAAATVGNAKVRAWGQKDTVNNRAHVWIQNSDHTWKNVIDGVTIAPITTTVAIPGFTANTALKVEWWDTYTGQVTKTENVTTSSTGQLTLPISNLTTDLAVRIGDYSTVSASAAPTVVPGDTNGDGHVTLVDYNNVIIDFGKVSTRADFNKSGLVDIYDYNIVISNFGT